jgi:hypothetical protein
MRYKLLKEECEEELSKRVEYYLNDGWDLHGSPSVSKTRREHCDVCTFIQAVIKYD